MIEFSLEHSAFWILAAAAGLLGIIALRLELRLRRLLRGKDGKSLEDSIVKIGSGLASLEQFARESNLRMQNLDTRIAHGIRAVETVRFNPWKGTGDGGNQSFASAFLNEHGDGVVISSLYSRERVSVYAKPITQLESEFSLSEEESEAVEKAGKAVAKSRIA